MQPTKNAIVLLIDGFNPTFLSPAGCTWIETPAFDHLAAESIMFERAVTESVDASDACWSFMAGKHPTQRSALNSENGECHQNVDWIQTLHESKINTVLMTDCRDQFSGGDNFELSIDLPSPDSSTDKRADDVSETHLAKCLALALNELPKLSSPFFCVVHLTSLTKVWDAPASMRENFRDEEDPPALTTTTAPNRTGEFDPDEILVTTQAYAAQIETLDTCLGVLMHELNLDGMLEQSMLVVGGLRGYPVGHRQQIGHSPNHLFSNSTTVPFFVRPACLVQHAEGIDSDFVMVSAVRSHELVCVSDWMPFIVESIIDQPTHWLHSIVHTQSQPTDSSTDDLNRQIAVARGESSRAIWTPAWLLVESGQENFLFVKPEDRWDFISVNDRCRWVVDDLQAMLDQACGQLDNNQPILVDPLANELVFGLE